MVCRSPNVERFQQSAQAPAQNVGAWPQSSTRVVSCKSLRRCSADAVSALKMGRSGAWYKGCMEIRSRLFWSRLQVVATLLENRVRIL